MRSESVSTFTKTNPARGRASGRQCGTSEYNRDGERILLPMFGAAVLVMLIACGKVGLGRDAVRAALGVGRAGLFRRPRRKASCLLLRAEHSERDSDLACYPR